MVPTPNGAYLRHAPLFLGIGILAFCGQVGLMLVEMPVGPPSPKVQLSWMWTLFFILVDVLFWGAFWWAIAQTTGHRKAAREAFFVSTAIVAVHFSIIFFAAQFLRGFLLEYFIQRGYPHPNASVFFLSIPILDFILWPFIALPVWAVKPPKTRLETFTVFQSSTGPNELKVILLILNAIFLFFSFRTTSGDDMIFGVLGFVLTTFYLFHPAGLGVFIVVQLLFTGFLLFFAFKAGSNGGEINYSRHIVQGLMTLVYAFILYGILHPQRMEAELEMEVED